MVSLQDIISYLKEVGLFLFVAIVYTFLFVPLLDGVFAVSETNPNLKETVNATKSVIELTMSVDDLWTITKMITVPLVWIGSPIFPLIRRAISDNSDIGTT